jgi:zinc protease
MSIAGSSLISGKYMKRIVLWQIIPVMAALLGGCGSREKLHDIRFENGLNLILMEKRDARVVTALMVVKAGSINESDSTHGISYMTTQSLFEVSKNYPNIKWELDSQGAEYTSNTTQDFSSFTVTVAADDWEKVLDIYSDVIRHSQFPDTILASVRRQMLRDIRSNENNLVLQNVITLLRTIFQKHPYRNLPLGREETVTGFTRKDVKRYYHDRFTPENITLVIVGDFKVSQAEKFLRKRLAGFSRKSSRVYAWEQEPPQTQPRIVKQIHRNIPNIALITVGWPAPSIDNDDTFGMDILLTSLIRERRGRLITQINDPMKSVYNVEAQYITPGEPGYFFVNAVCSPDSIEMVQEKIMREIEILRKDSITPKELETAKMYIKSSHAYYQESTYGIAYGHLGYWTIVQDLDFAKSYLPNIMKVTLEDVRIIANRYLGEDNYTMIINRPVR